MVKQATMVTILQAAPDQDRIVFGVFRALVHTDPAHRWCWDVHQAEHVASVTYRVSDDIPEHHKIAQPYATADWPVFYETH